MRRSMMFTALLNLEPVEFGRLEQAPLDLAGAVITAACEGVPVGALDQYAACREWLASIPGEREPGWLKAYALTLISEYDRMTDADILREVGMTEAAEVLDDMGGSF